MLNFFFAYGILWIIICILYLLGWSDLCFKLDGNLCIFIIFMILISMILGYKYRKKFVFKKGEINMHKNSKITILFIIFHIFNFIYMGYIPLLKIVGGESIKTLNMQGIPLIGNFIVWSSIFYSFNLSYNFLCFKTKKTLFDNVVIVFLLLLYAARQNVLICILMFINLWVSKFFTEHSLKKQKRKIPILIVLILIVLYLFGIMGNKRYGDNWAWNDSSMIFRAGYKNEKYPKFLAGEYFWTYIYLVSPLANLNYNVINHSPSYDFEDYIYEYVPDFIKTKIGNHKSIDIDLPSKSLTVGTAYVKPYLNFGMVGVYIFFIVQLLFCLIIVLLDDRIKKKSKNSITIYCILLYFLTIAFFDNTFTYSITSFGLIIALILALGIGDNLKINNKNKKVYE